MTTRQRPAHRGAQRGRDLSRAIGRGIRLSLSLKQVGRAVGISASELSRIERGLADRVSLHVLAQLCAVVGLDLAAKAFREVVRFRDARHAALLDRFRSKLHASLRWSVEVPLPNPGDQRAWDALIRGDGWRFGTEAELNPIDRQALIRRFKLKQREGGVDGVILLLPDTRQARQFRREFAELLATDFPVSARVALQRLAAGEAPGGNAIVII